MLDTPLHRSAGLALKDCLAAEVGESVLVLTDTVCRNVGRAFFEAALDLSLHAVYVEIPPLQRNGQEPDDAIARLMRDFSLVVAPTSKSLTHTSARREACAAGARVATMPGIQEDTVIRCLAADHEAIARRTETVAEFGVGTNDAARIIGNILEDEKVMGTIHIAFGNNVSMGGSVNVPIHLDGIVLSPSVEVDGKPLMDAGKLILA